MTVSLVRKTAKELAGAFYEDNHSDRFRKFWPSQKVFIARNWPSFVEIARVTLTELLRCDGTPEYQKTEIYEALCEDNERQIRGRHTDVGKGRMTLNPDRPGAMERKMFYQ